MTSHESPQFMRVCAMSHNVGEQHRAARRRMYRLIDVMQKILAARRIG
jgi:hypothetical protein